MSTLRVGAIIGRFQVPALHRGHEEFTKSVYGEYDQVVILIGVSPLDGKCAENPLTFRQRTTLFNTREAPAIPLLDMASDVAWSKQCDDILTATFPDADITLCHGRDSGFVKSYCGRLPVRAFEAYQDYSGRGVRASIEEGKSAEFMRGQIYALQNQYPHAYPTVDIAVTRERYGVLLIQRTDSKEWGFVGGFVDPTDHSLESAAKRELYEETGLTCESGPRYVASGLITDWRYRGCRDQVMTTLFHVKHSFGTVTADPKEVADYRWCPFEEAAETISNVHRPLWNALKIYLGPNGLTRAS